MRNRQYVRHPYNEQAFDVNEYADIRCCNKNPTHIDFYKAPQAEGERGNPDFTIEFKTKEERDQWFLALIGEVEAWEF